MSRKFASVGAAALEAGRGHRIGQLETPGEEARLRQGLKLAHGERLAAPRELFLRLRQPAARNRLVHLHVPGQFGDANHRLGQPRAFALVQHLEERHFPCLLGGSGHAEDQQRRGRFASQQTLHIGALPASFLPGAANRRNHVAQGRQVCRPVTLLRLRKRRHLRQFLFRQLGLLLLQVPQDARRQQAQPRPAHRGMNAVDALRLGQKIERRFERVALLLLFHQEKNRLDIHRADLMPCFGYSLGLPGPLAFRPVHPLRERFEAADRARRRVHTAFPGKGNTSPRRPVCFAGGRSAATPPAASSGSLRSMSAIRR